MSDPGISLLETCAREAERASLTVHGADSRLESTLKAVELYMEALQLSDRAVDRKRLNAKCKELLTKAETLRWSKDDDSARCLHRLRSRAPRVPKSTRKLTTREKIILLEGSKLNGFIFKPWEDEPRQEEFACKAGEPLFMDSATLALSDTQLKSFAGWKRPLEALANIELDQEDGTAERMPTMLPKGKVDLVQDLTSDCSVVASLCAGVSRTARGYPKILRALIFPYDYEDDRPSFSPSGRYVLKLNFNGCWRRVEIDDLLPASNNDRVLHVMDRSNPGLLWPALVEKAYLKVRGGYDFPGSNSGTDLAVLTGWIPQQIFLHDGEVGQEELWKSLFNEFREGNLLLTMGTGKLSKLEQQLHGLAAEHDYAILDMKAENDHREVLVKNPWSDGDVWRGAVKRRPNPSCVSTADLDAAERPELDAEMAPGTFWMDFSSVFQHFENIYVNWNPQSFAFREDIHFTWDSSTCSTYTNLFTCNPQFAVRSSKGGKVWVLLNRHFKTGDYEQARNGKNGYISLYVFKRDGLRVISSDSAMVRGPFVDSPNTLVRLDMPPKMAFTSVVAAQDLPDAKCNFTLSVFAENPVELSEAVARYYQETSRAAAWTRTSAGGNSDSPRYLSNPQFSTHFQAGTEIALVLDITTEKDSQQQDVSVKVLVVFSDGSRIAKLRPRDVIANSGDYRRGSAVIQTTLDKGSYTIICSTFDRDQYASFNLTLYTAGQHPPRLSLLPAINSGRLSIISLPAVFDDNTNRLLAPMTISRITRAILMARPYQSDSRSTSMSLYKLLVEQGQGPYKHVLASSASDDETREYTNIPSHLQIDDMDLRPDFHGPGTGGLWLVLERPPQACPVGVKEVVEVEILAEERIDLGKWGCGDG